MKKIYYILTILLCVYVQTANAQMGVNSTGAAPDASAILDVKSTDKGFLLPRLTTVQRNAMPAISNGLMIYNTTTAEIEVFRGFSGWVAASRMGVPFTVTGSTAIGGSGIIEATNNGTGHAIRGFGVGGGFGVYGQGGSTGVYGITTSGTGTGVYGATDSNRGVWGRGLTTGDGVYGDATTGNAVRGEASTTGTGGYFRSVTGEAIDASTGNNFAIRADNNSASTATGSFFNLALGTGVKIIGGANALDITGGIKVSGGATNKAAFKIQAAAGDIFLNQLIIPNTTLANNITDIVMITHNYGAGATNNFVKPCGVYWEAGTSTWRIYVEDGSAMPVGITFNILVIKQ
jgi:hypothetical protein